MIIPESPMSFKLREKDNRSRVYRHVEKSPHINKDGNGNRLPLASQREIAHQMINPLQRASPHARRCFIVAQKKNFVDNNTARKTARNTARKTARKTYITWADRVEVKEVDYGAVISPSGKTEKAEKKERWRSVKDNIPQAYSDMKKSMHI